MEKKNSIVFYKSFYEAIKELPKENQLDLYNAIFEKYFFDNEIKLTGLSKGIFQIIKPNIDSANKRYFANIENGKKGGRPKKNNPIETQTKPNENSIETQHKSQKNLNVNDNDNVNVNDKENVNDNVNKKEKKKKETDFDKLINKNFTDEELKNTIYEFIKMRKAIKKPLTTRGLELMIKKLYSLSTNIDEQIQILNNSIMNNWQGIFPLKKETTKSNTKPEQRKYTEKDFNKFYTNFN